VAATRLEIASLHGINDAVLGDFVSFGAGSRGQTGLAMGIEKSFEIC
jgi:hypothetical protein